MSLIHRCRTVITGVGGSPYYMDMNFDPAGGTPQQQADAWYDFCTRGEGPTGLKVGARYSGSPEVRVIESTTGEVTDVITVDATAVTGSYTGGYLPPANQVLVRWSTGQYVGGRQVRGKTYCPLITIEAANDDGSVDPTTLSLFGDQAQELALNLTVNPVVWSRTSGQVFPVTGSSVWGQFAILRSRRD